MIQYLYADQLVQHPDLRTSMFRDRAAQFSTRLKWDVTLDADGLETDAYDALNPLYVIWKQPDGRHGGSMRFLPTTGPVMVNDHTAFRVDWMPFAGLKHSGHGVGGIPHTFREMQTEKMMLIRSPSL